MAHLRWIIGVGMALIALPIAAAFLFPPRAVIPVPEPRFVSPKIVYRLPPAQPNDLTAVAVRKQGGLVTLRANTDWDTPGVALHTFIAALKTYPHARRVRVSWHMLLAMNNTDSTALYDRRRHSVVFFSQGDGDLGAFRNHIAFTGVQEPDFVRLADAHRYDSDENPWGCFDDLPKYGCRKHDLGSWSKAPAY